MYSEKLKETCLGNKWYLFFTTNPVDLSLRNELFLKTNFLNGNVPYLLRVFCVNNDVLENSVDLVNSKEYKEFSTPKQTVIQKIVKSVKRKTRGKK